MRAPISLCIIVRDDPFIEKSILSIRDFVEEVVVVDTGSTPENQALGKKHADIFEVFTACNDPQTGMIEDFSMARNRSFDLATKPWVMWQDSDDLIEGAQNLIKITSEYDTKRTDIEGISYLFPYEYSYNDQGKCNCRHYRERLFYNKKAFGFVNPVHEVAIPKPNARVQLIQREEVLFKHQRQFNPKIIEPGRNLRILSKYFEKIGESDARQMYYLGLELTNAGRLDEAIKMLSRYIELSGWDDERAMAALKLIDIYQAMGRYEEALKWGFKTIEIKENWCEGYFGLAKMFYFLACRGGAGEQRNWERLVYFARIGFSLPPTQTLLFINPQDREYEIHKYYNVALNKLGDVKGARDSAATGLSSQPNDGNLALNKKLYDIFLAKQQIMPALGTLKDTGDLSELAYNTLVSLLNKQIDPDSFFAQKLLPNTSIVQNTPIVVNASSKSEAAVVQNMSANTVWDDVSRFRNTGLKIKDYYMKDTDIRVEYQAQEKDVGPGSYIKIPNKPKLDIVFAIGDGMEIWTPETVKKIGQGGSEIMAIENAKRLAALGHNVRVYAGCGAAGEGIYDGVEYYQPHKYQNLKCDVLVVSRNAAFLGDQFNIEAKLRLLWVHDVCVANGSPELLLKADRIIALTEWHRQNIIGVHCVHPDHVVVSRNGIDIDRFVKPVVRNKFKAVNSSSPDRSWPILLEVWPQIRARVPQAELHLYYGFKNWEIVAANYPGQPELIARLKQQIADLKPLGVVYHDRVGQKELADEFSGAGVWAFSTWWSETSCISAMEAHAAGLRMVTSANAALNETVAGRGVLVRGDWTSSDYKQTFVEGVVAAMLKEDDSDRLALQRYAKEHFCLNKLAKDWEAMFFSLIEMKKTYPIVPYHPTPQYRNVV